MRRSGGYCVRRVAAKWDVRAQIGLLARRARSACIGRLRTERVRLVLPAPVAH